VATSAPEWPSKTANRPTSLPSSSSRNSATWRSSMPCGIRPCTRWNPYVTLRRPDDALAWLLPLPVSRTACACAAWSPPLSSSPTWQQENTHRAYRLTLQKLDLTLSCCRDAIDRSPISLIELARVLHARRCCWNICCAGLPRRLSYLFIQRRRWSCECRGAAPDDTYVLRRGRGGASSEHLAASLVKWLGAGRSLAVHTLMGMGCELRHALQGRKERGRKLFSELWPRTLFQNLNPTFLSELLRIKLKPRV
jgi:hypothetical protein